MFSSKSCTPMKLSLHQLCKDNLGRRQRKANIATPELFKIREQPVHFSDLYRNSSANHWQFSFGVVSESWRQSPLSIYPRKELGAESLYSIRPNVLKDNSGLNKTEKLLLLDALTLPAGLGSRKILSHHRSFNIALSTTFAASLDGTWIQYALESLRVGLIEIVGR
ncbi:hypothetical protein BU26DRAFT_3483 [Trematosphaeria pertusa]|uniref:Uncharacterized protein n=1 Tax=Trematosphaeria pertusa TaxID=390896 RepID=A0A6A6IYG3_9PLEO|nr:uncharacterized protein BU26DRAFT_3483 [Trematosphaeria pertusa]KAF2255585.1 hypothetical protein BU26DRAFT_3483 [Trematosphaeria pertusa]